MKKMHGVDKAELQELPQIKERISFLYVERCLINRQDSAVSITDGRGTVNVPVASISVLLFGPGTNVTHRAMELIGDVGTSVIWVGENGVRYYAHGKPLTHSARLLIKQAKLVSNTQSRLMVARKMYQIRFPEEDVSALTMQQLRGKEGARIRSIYRACAKETKVDWNGREYNHTSFSDGNLINQALSAAHACLYGIAHSVIVAMGCSPGLGFVHNGHERSFVYDIADLYKADITIPISFQIAAEEPEDIAGVVRREIRDVIVKRRLLEQITRDIHYLLLDEKDEVPEVMSESIVDLWDDKKGLVKNGISYGKELDDEDKIFENGYGILIEGEK